MPVSLASFLSSAGGYWSAQRKPAQREENERIPHTQGGVGSNFSLLCSESLCLLRLNSTYVQKKTVNITPYLYSADKKIEMYSFVLMRDFLLRLGTWADIKPRQMVLHMSAPEVATLHELHRPNFKMDLPSNSKYIFITVRQQK